jgi:hypothetical protein
MTHPKGEALHAATKDLARRGARVFPVHYPVEIGGRLRCSCGNAECKNAAKHPYARLAPRGLLDATTDFAQIDRWWGAGVPYNIGIRTGEESGIVVVDVDPRHSGDKTLSDLERRFGALPPTWRFLTGGGGEHIVFRHPGYRVQNGAGSLGDGIDVRADGGFIVGPASRHISGRLYMMMSTWPDCRCGWRQWYSPAAMVIVRQRQCPRAGESSLLKVFSKAAAMTRWRGSLVIFCAPGRKIRISCSIWFACGTPRGAALPSTKPRSSEP